jgi:hypothetical protein
MAWRRGVYRWAVVMLVLLGGACRRAPTTEKSLVVRLPKAYEQGSTVIADDGRAYAFVARTPDGEQVVSTQGTSDVHRQCVGLAFAPKTARLFYWTRDVADGASTITLVADGQRIVTDFLANGKMGFSADGSRWFAAGAAPGATPQTLGDLTLWVDGAQAARGPDLGLPAFSADGRHMAYLATTDQRRLIVDGVASRTFETPAAPCGVAAVAGAPRPDLPLRHVVSYLADDRLLVVTRDADGWRVERDGERLASYPRAAFDAAEGACTATAAIAPRSLRTAERAPVAVWWERVAGDAERWRVVRDGHPVDDVVCTETWKHQPPEPSPDGQRVVYPCVVKDATGVQSVVLVDGSAQYGPYDDVWGIAFSKNGAHVAYGAARGADPRPWVLYVDGEKRVSGLATVWRPRVSDDGAIVAWEGTLEAKGRGVFGINGRRLGLFDEVVWGPEFEPDERVAWVLRRGRKLVRVRAPCPALRAAPRS